MKGEGDDSPENLGRDAPERRRRSASERRGPSGTGLASASRWLTRVVGERARLDHALEVRRGRSLRWERGTGGEQDRIDKSHPFGSTRYGP